MKLSEVIFFLTFSSVTENVNIEKKFNDCHSGYKSRLIYWSTNATRRKLISEFWYTQVIKHFAVLYSRALLVSFFSHPDALLNPYGLLIIGSWFWIGFIVTAAFIYMPTFYTTYLQLLDSYIEKYTGQQLEHIQKCKKQQYSVRALLLIQYTFQKLSGLSVSYMDNIYANLLSKQYGISLQMIDNANKEIFMGKWDGKEGRKYTEIVNSFEEAETYFNDLKADNAFPILHELRTKVLSRKNNTPELNKW
jgi:hypothetical protein